MLPLGTSTITYKAQNISGNSSTVTRNITVISGKPHITATLPVSNTSFYQHQNVNFAASATDFPQGNISSAIKWYSNLQGYLGSGQTLTRLLNPGIHAIKAVVQDNAGSIDSVLIAPITIRFTPPVPVIIQPLTNSSFIYHDTVRLIGHAADLQDGALHGNHLKWYSNLQGFLGFGDTLSVSVFIYGYHTITLKATDNDNADSTVAVANILIDAGQPV
jgi:hypothetical protein